MCHHETKFWPIKVKQWDFILRWGSGGGLTLPSLSLHSPSIPVFATQTKVSALMELISAWGKRQKINESRYTMCLMVLDAVEISKVNFKSLSHV